MKNDNPRIDCYIGSFCRPLQEAWLEDRGFSHGMVMFAIPSHGILFKCRAEGNKMDLEFGAFFSLLRFIRSSLSKEKIKSVRVLSSHPEFVFTVLNKGRHLNARPRRYKMFREYLARFDVEVVFVPARRNKTVISPAEYPSVPRGAEPSLKPRTSPTRQVRIRPFQKGVRV